MSNQRDVSGADGEVCGDVCDLRDEAKEGGENFRRLLMLPSGFYVPYDVSPLKQRHAVGGICAFTQNL